MATSFRSFFDERKCEGCNEGVMVRGGDWDEQVLDCPDPCPRRKDVEYVYEQFNNWLDNIETKLSDDDFFAMVHTKDSEKMSDKFFEVYKNAYTDISEAFNAWLEEHKHLFTADDYFEMGKSV